MKHGLLACSHVHHNVQKTERRSMKACRLAPVLKTFSLSMCHFIHTCMCESRIFCQGGEGGGGGWGGGGGVQV